MSATSGTPSIDSAAPLQRLRPIGRERPEPAQRSVVRRSQDGDELGEVALDPSWFGVEPNRAVLHQVVTAQLAAARAGSASTLRRSEVRGGGAKPYRQKGTGRARQGSIRATQFAGGGIPMGPKPRSHRQRTPKKMVRAALVSALSDRAAEERIALVDRWSWEVPRTKGALEALAALSLDGRVLVVIGADDEVARRSFANLPRVDTLVSAELNAYDILRSDWVVFTDATLPGATPVDAAQPETAAAEATAEPAAAEATADTTAPEAPTSEAETDDGTRDGDQEADTDGEEEA